MTMRWPWSGAIDRALLECERAREGMEQALTAFAATAPPANENELRSTDKRLVCPECASPLPPAPVAVLHSVIERDGRTMSVETGKRVACQAKNCNAQWSYGPDGIFRHDPNAMPYTGEMVNREPQSAEPAPPKRPRGERVQQPEWRERPDL
jgi:hypothetical protein